MRLWVLGFWCALVLCGSSSGLAQQPSGPRTLEGLLNSEEAQKPAAAAVPVADATDDGPKRPAGTVTRPKDGVQHPDLDKAWADYDAAVTKVAEGIRAAINKQFDAAAAKGDLDAAEKWQVLGEKFEKAGELPTEKEAKAAVGAAVADCKKAREELAAAYEAVVKALTTEKKIAEAKAVRGEYKSLGSFGTAKPEPSHASASEPMKQPPDTQVKKPPDLRNRLFRVMTSEGRVLISVFLRNDGTVHDDSHNWDMRLWSQQGDVLDMKHGSKRFVYRYSPKEDEWISPDKGERLKEAK